jgi:hypothetical protein
MMPLLKTNLPLNSLIQNGQVRTAIPFNIILPYNSHHFVDFSLFIINLKISQNIPSVKHALPGREAE